MGDLLREGGLWAVAVVFLGGLGSLLVVGMTAAAFTVKKRGVALAAVAFCAFTIVGLLAVSGLGYFLNMRDVNAALEFAPPEMREALLEQGKADASIAVTFAAAFCVLPSFCALAAMGLAMVRSKDSESAR